MFTMKSHLMVVTLNEYGGIVETLGYPYLSIEDLVVTIHCELDDINHLGETIFTRQMLQVTLCKKIPEKYLEGLYFAFGKGFGSNFAYNYASYHRFKQGAKEYLLRLNKQL